MKNRRFDTCQKYAAKMDTVFVLIAGAERYIKLLIKDIVANVVTKGSMYSPIVGTAN